MKPKSTRKSSHVSVPINLSDVGYAETWIRAITESVKPGTKSLDVFFLGGGSVVEPTALLSLRNTILLAPKLAGRPVFIRTFAACSLSPFACIAWLTGDERWMARDASIWIPELPESILRGKPLPARAQKLLSLNSERTDQTDDSDEDDGEQTLNLVFGPRKRATTKCTCNKNPGKCACGMARMANDLSTMAAIVNEWFPSWEYSGRCISCDELIELRVIKPSWTFGGSISHPGAVRHVDEDEPRDDPAQL